MINVETKEVSKTVSDKLSIDAGIVFYDFLMALSGEMYSSDMICLVLRATGGSLVDRGYKEEEVDKAIAVVAKVLSSRRSKFTQDFMG